MTPEELSDHTHNGMMNHALSSVAAIFEGDGWSPCDALHAANGLLEPAFRAWGELINRVMADDKRIRELEAEIGQLKQACKENADAWVKEKCDAAVLLNQRDIEIGRPESELAEPAPPAREVEND